MYKKARLLSSSILSLHGYKMQKLLIVLALVACVFAMAKGMPKLPKAPKPVKQLKTLCERAVSERGLTIVDGNFTDVFEDLETEFCEDFLANYSSYYRIPKESVTEAFDPIRTLDRVCKWFLKRNSEDTEGALMGLFPICMDYEVAVNNSLGIGDGGDDGDDAELMSPKLDKLTSLCKKAVRGKLTWDNSSYDMVMGDFSDICGDYLEETTGESTWSSLTKMGKSTLDQVDGICKWIQKQDDLGDGALSDFDDWCTDFFVVRYGV